MFESVDKFCDKLEKNKVLKKMDVHTYSLFNCWLNLSETRRYWIMSEIEMKETRRELIVKTLKDTNYKRNGKSWTSETVAAFIEEVLNLNSTSTKEEKLEISKRYDVEINKFNSMVSFFMGLKRSTYSLNLYFTEYDFLSWKYRDEKTLEKAIEAETISQREIDMLKELKTKN